MAAVALLLFLLPLLLLLVLLAAPPPRCLASTISNGWLNGCVTPSQWTTPLADPANATDQYGNVLMQRIPAVCDSPWEAYDGRCYMFSQHASSGLTAALYQGDAVYACKNLGASLVSIFTPREFCFARKSIRDASGPVGCDAYPTSTQTCWTGAYQSAGGGYAFEFSPSQDDIIASTAFTFDPIPTRNGGATPWDPTASGSSCDPFYDSSTCTLASSGYTSCEPKNVGTGAGGENCVAFSKNNVAWVLQRCTQFSLAYICARAARCPPGYERTKPFTGMPKRVTSGMTGTGCKDLVKDYGTSQGYSPGACTQCPPGKWHAQASFATANLVCEDCDAGRFGYAGATLSQCNGACQPGYYCIKGTGFNQMAPCPAGTYNPLYSQTSNLACTIVDAGYFSLGAAAVQQPCLAGYCGYPGSTKATCEEKCPPGHYCTSGTGCFNQTATVAKFPVPCGNKMFYAPQGTGVEGCLQVSLGYYTQGATEQTRSSQVVCPAGHYCPGDGDHYSCPVGTYRSGTGSASLSQCLSCDAGYFCPAGSTTPTAEYCGLSGQPYPPVMYYCPAGTTQRLLCPPGNYTLDPLGPENSRYGIASCSSNDICVNGTARTRLQWAGDSCEKLSVQENRVNASLPRILFANKDPSMTQFTVQYALLSVTLPCVGDSNAGIFALNESTGQLELTRTSFPTWLDYESCGLSLPKYQLLVQANASAPGETSAVLECTIYLQLTDANDQPYWLPEENNALTSYRGFPELSDINTAVIRCDATEPCAGVANQLTQAVELKAFDHDYSSAGGAGLRYTFVPGLGDYVSPDEANPFRINACSGLVTARFDRQITYASAPTLPGGGGARGYSYTVRVTDDGNGGEFPKLSADFPMVIFIHQVPKPPVLPLPSTVNLSIVENQPAGTELAGQPIEAMDSDIPPDAIYYRLVQTLDYVYFSMHPTTFVLTTTSLGASTIDFESTKTQYRIEVEASNCPFTDSSPCPVASDKQTYVVTVLNSNDPPVFVDPYPLYVLEHATDGTVLCMNEAGSCPSATPVGTTDPDTVSEPLDVTTYSLVSDGHGMFLIHPTSGIISTAPGSQARLNFENATFNVDAGSGRGLTITVRATSSGNNSPSTDAVKDQEYAVFLVDVNEAPVFNLASLPTFFVLETAPVGSRADLVSGSVDLIQATDPDNLVTVLRGVPVPPQALTFSDAISLTYPSLADNNNVFAIVSTSSGAYVRVNSQVTYADTPPGGVACGAGASTETRCYAIRVKVQDSGGPSKSAFVDVFVQVVNVNSGPQFTALSTAVTISESAARDGAVTVTPGTLNNLVASDDATQYVFIMDGGSGAGVFNITSLMGLGGFQVFKKPNTQLDFESPFRSYFLTVSVRDTGTSKYVGMGCGLVNGQPAGCGSDALCLVFSDSDPPLVTTYGVHRCFEKCQDGVTLRMHKYYCDYGVDPHPPSSQAADSTLRVDISVLDANDPPYVIDSQGGIPAVGTCSISGTVVWQSRFSDQTAIAQVFVQDQDLTFGTFPSTPYSFWATDPSAAIWQTFNLSSTTGALTRSYSLYPDLPSFEIGDVWNGTITVRDGNTSCPACPTPWLETQCNVTIRAVSTNNPPKFPVTGSYLFTVREGQTGLLTTSLVPNVTAVDPDAGDTITFDMAQNAYFSVNASTSAFTLFAPLDYEGLASNGFKSEPIVRVRDVLGMEDVHTITVYVTDVNEKPSWVSAQYSVSVNESLAAGTLLTNANFSSAAWQAQVTDPDLYTAAFHEHVFQIVPGSGCDASCPFELVHGGRQMRVKNPLPSPNVMDYEGGGPTSWVFDVDVVDVNNTLLTDRTQFRISLVDLPEPPVVQSTSVSVSEGAAGTSLLDLFAAGVVTDVDSADMPVASHVSMALSGPGATIFEIQAAVLKVAPGNTLDYEKDRSFTLTLTATDSFGLQGVGTITVNVFNVPDITITNAQVISGSSLPNLPCDGSMSRVRLYGTNFGLYEDNPGSTETFTVTYQRQALLDMPTTYTATNCARPIASGIAGHNTQLECDVNRGAGGVSLSFAIRVQVSGGGVSIDDAGSFQSSINYDPPVVLSLTSGDAGGITGFSTAGGGSLQLTGLCLGNSIVAGSPPYVSTRDGMNFHTTTDHLVELCTDYDGCRSLTSGCTATTANATVVSCSNAMLAGMGANLKWRVKVGGRFSNQLTAGAYGLPVISSSNFPVSGPSAVLLDTAGNNFPYALELSGTNLGTVTPSYIAFVYEHPPGGSEAYRFYFALQGCMILIPHTRIRCLSSEPGVGNSLMVKVVIGGQANNFAAYPNLARFQGPTFTELGGPGAVDATTIGGQIVTITGTQFGPPCGLSGTSTDSGAVNCPYLSASYTRGSPQAMFPFAALVYRPTLCAVMSQTTMSCTTVEGTGAGHVWTLTVASQTAPANPTATTSYATPVVASYDGPGAVNGNTDGNQTIFVEGSDFGPKDGALITARYGGALNRTEFQAADCFVSVAHTQITCSTAAGAGKDLSWVVTVDGQDGTNEKTDYGRPTVDSTTFVGPYLSNDGGEVLILQGTNFGPPTSPGPFLDWVRFGPSLNLYAYSMRGCVVLNHTHVSCITPPGSGSAMGVSASVKTQQTLAPSTFKLAYQPPVIDSVTIPLGVLRTSGGDRMRVLGRGFAMCDPQSFVQVQIRPPNGAVRLVSPSVVYHAVSGVQINPPNQNCPLGTTAVQLEFLTPEMGVLGVERYFDVAVKVTSGTLGQAFVTPVEIRVTYDAPVLDSVYVQATVVSGTVQVTLYGSNFCGSETCCQTWYQNAQVPSGSVISHTHNAISIVASGTGAVEVRCGQNKTRSLSFSTNSPFVTGTVPALGQLDFRTDGSQSIDVWGLYFGSDMAPVVTIGGAPCNVTCWTGDNAECGIVNCAGTPSAPRPYTALSSYSSSCFRLKCTVPQGTGRDKPLVVTRDGSSSSLPTDTRYEFLTYAAPLITSASGSSLTSEQPSEGGGILLISGQDFGPFRGVVWVGGRDPVSGDFSGALNCSVQSWTHTQIQCVIPPGEGSNLPLTVAQYPNSPQTGSFTILPATYLITYAPPSNVDYVQVQPSPTQGGDVLVVTGLNFGRPWRSPCVDDTCSSTGPMVTVGGKVCLLVSNNFTMILCHIPEGEGIDNVVKVVVAGREAQASSIFLYAAPTLLSASQYVDLPTSGLVASGSSRGGPMLLTLTGTNLGVNRVQVYFNNDIVKQRFVSTDPQLNINEMLPDTNHFQLVFRVPEYWGANNTVRVRVGGQDSPKAPFVLSYKGPSIVNTTVLLEDGTTRVATSEQSTTFASSAFDPVASGLPPSVLVEGGGARLRRRHRVLMRRQDQGGVDPPFVLWTTCWDMDRTFCLGVCESDTRQRGVFWRSQIDIAPNGQYVRVFYHYDGSDGTCADPLDQMYVVRVTGQFEDLGPSGNLACGGRMFANAMDKLEVRPLTETAVSVFKTRCDCGVLSWAVGVTVDLTSCLVGKQCELLQVLYMPGGVQRQFGTYFIADNTDVYMSRTDGTLEAAITRTNFKFSDFPVAFVNPASTQATSVLVYARGPTDGCYVWEDPIPYLERARAIAEATGVPINTIPLKCQKRALMTLTGDNFGLGPVEVVFRAGGPGTEEFVGSTAYSKGGHSEPCPPSDCPRTHTSLTFWVPFGVGKNLNVLVRVGNQETEAAQKFTYLPPKLEEVLPGTVQLGRGFVNANGWPVKIRGTNFGGRSTTVNVLVNGKTCLNSQWNTGSVGGEDGRPYVTCDLVRDVVGPRLVSLCVASQITARRLFRSDGPVLRAADEQKAWSPTSPLFSFFADQIHSLVVARCPNNTVGKLYELCLACPEGASCPDDGSAFSGPKSGKGMSKSVIPVYNEDGTLNPRAREGCAPEAWNTSLLEEYPDLVQRSTCDAFLGCEPPSACAGNDTCAAGYEYAKYRCQRTRGYKVGNDSAFFELTHALVRNTTNECRIVLDPYTNEYVGVDADCRGITPVGQPCDADHPEQCAKCQVLVDPDSLTKFGACKCELPERCTLCTMGTHYRLNNECVECPSNPGLVIAMLFVGAVAVAAIGWWFNARNVNLAFVTIGIDYLQVLALLSTTKVPWPQSVKELLRIMAVFNFNIDIAAPECLTPNFKYEVKWWLTELIPVAVAVVLLVAGGVYSLVKISKWGLKSNTHLTHVSALVSIFTIVMYYLYLALTKRALDVFNCNPISPSDGHLYTSFTDLECDGGGLCQCPSGANPHPGGPQPRLFPWGIIALVVYSFGFPAYVGFTLWRQRQKVIIDQYLRAFGAGDSRATNPLCYDVRKRYSKLYYQFKPRFASFWILMLLSRKFCIALASLLFRSNPTFQLSVILLVLFVALVMQVLWRPFMSTGEKVVLQIELGAMAERATREKAFAEFVVIQQRVNEARTLDVKHRRTGKQKKIDMNTWASRSFTEAMVGPDGKRRKPVTLRDRTTTASILAAMYFANLNTLEFTLLGCGILVCLAGIMFDSAKNDTRPLVMQQSEAVAWLLLMVLVFSLLYYISFFLAEVAPSFVSWVLRVLRQCVGRNVHDREQHLDEDIQLADNPFYSTAKKVPVDQRELQGMMAESLTALEKAEAENRQLRDDLKKRKQEAQLNESKNIKGAQVEDSQDKPYKRKEFAAARLTTHLSGARGKNRARGGRAGAGAAAVEDEGANESTTDLVVGGVRGGEEE